MQITLVAKSFSDFNQCEINNVAHVERFMNVSQYLSFFVRSFQRRWKHRQFTNQTSDLILLSSATKTSFSPTAPWILLSSLSKLYYQKRAIQNWFIPKHWTFWKLANLFLASGDLRQSLDSKMTSKKWGILLASWILRKAECLKWFQWDSVSDEVAIERWSKKVEIERWRAIVIILPTLSAYDIMPWKQDNVRRDDWM